MKYLELGSVRHKSELKIGLQLRRFTWITGESERDYWCKRG